MLIPLAGVLGVVLQLTLAAAGLAGLAVAFSPVYGCAWLYLSLRPVLLSPEMAVLSARVHAAGGALQSMNDPQLAIAVQALTQRGALDFLLPLLAMLCADVGQALYVATGAFVWDAMHALGAAVAAGALAWATWGDGAHATSTASYACWAVAVGAAAMLAKLADAAWGGALAAPKPGGAGWASLFGGSQVLLSAHAALAPAVCALLSRTGGALLAAAVPAARARRRRRRRAAARRAARAGAIRGRGAALRRARTRCSRRATPPPPSGSSRRAPPPPPSRSPRGASPTRRPSPTRR